ncbi:MAG: response regulator [Candidatus Omnitrophica bacterium]|nr:response regulator [Candidatus Omnitrophota bacterium]
MSKKILIVDDEQNILKMVESRLLSAGYEVACAKSGREGLDILKNETIDMIVLDVVMPDIDGFDFFKTIKKDPKTADISVIILTGRAAMQDTFEAMGVDDFVSKPFEGANLLAKIEGVFKGRALVFSNQTSATEVISRVISSEEMVLDIVESEDDFFSFIEKNKYKVLITHLAAVKKTPKDFMDKVKMSRNSKTKRVMYSDVKVPGLEHGSKVAIKEVMTLWQHEGINAFFDARLEEGDFSKVFSGAYKS